MRIDPNSMEELTVAADPDPYFALPRLYGGPAYARPPRVAQEAERPFDPDDLPIAAARMTDEPAFAGVSFSSASYHSIGSESLLAAASRSVPSGAAAASPPDSATSRFSLRTLANRLGPRQK